MNQLVKDKMKQEVMVVDNKLLFSEIKRETKFYYNDEYNFEENILKNYTYMVREKAETDYNYKQPVPYWIVINEKNEIFVYKRWWAWSNSAENRLHSKISIWVGWHIEREDENTDNPLRDTLVREIEEELGFNQKDIKSVEPIGYLNYDADEVSKFHIWTCYIVKVDNPDIKLLDWELEKWDFMNILEIEKLLKSWQSNLEWWSKTLFEPIKKLIS